MMGKQKKPAQLFSYSAKLEERIPADYYLRRLKQALDLSSVRDAVKDAYGCNGNESVDPEVIVKLMLLLFPDDIPSERELMRMLGYRPDYLWFLDYGLDDAIPDHRVLSKARKRWGQALFERLFVETVGQCYQAGLVAGKELFADGALVDANAGLDSVRKGSAELLQALSGAYAREERKLEGAADSGRADRGLPEPPAPDRKRIRKELGSGGPEDRIAFCWLYNQLLGRIIRLSRAD